MIGIIDYGMGNIFSLRGALNRLNTRHLLVDNPGQLEKCTALILPGVGAFGDAMENLKSTGLREELICWVKQGKPLLGICLGMQLLFEFSQEYGYHAGLGLLPGTIKKLPPNLKVPHMGWNLLEIRREHQVFQGFTPGHVYFVHSYYAHTPQENVLASAGYGIQIPAIVGRGNLIGMQFHPEKSGLVGLDLLENYLKMV